MPPALTVVLLSRVPPGPGWTPVAARCRTLSPAGRVDRVQPGRVDALLDALDRGVDHAVCGSMKKIDAHVRPAAVALNTSGMKTIVLNAVDQRMRSVSTANTSPKNVTRNGKTHHPDDVVLERDDDVRRREDRLVVAEADEALYPTPSKRLRTIVAMNGYTTMMSSQIAPGRRKSSDPRWLLKPPPPTGVPWSGAPPAWARPGAASDGRIGNAHVTSLTTVGRRC